MTPALRIRRVLVVAGTYADAEAAIPLAVRLAEISRAEVTGVLAEDPAALELPGHAAFTGASGPVRMTAERMLEAFGADARAFEARLGRAAARAALGWRFRRESGALPEVLERLARRDDIALLGYRRVLRVRGPIVAMGRDLRRRGGSESVALAEALARALRLPVLVMRIGGGDGGHDASDEVSVADEQSALHMLDSLAPTALILDAGMADMARGPGLVALIETARCPVLLRGATEAAAP